ncbi:hypothetical protein NIES267_34510 [Calothrix parasitica NIES-267]|uniref:PIN domain-containing protein n=1 Tax=Calothrix parasitica NIES-267 TaxID=1973488 RepID=A0A1Z4LRY1_9CYAN|nr:hypothetical protein NIES267_34510 [Calothrix parasitica NIES-267]
MQIKLQLGKLNLNSNLPELIDNQQQVNNLQILPIDLAHIYALNNLPSHHKDPFDRLLIARTIVEQMPIVSIDEVPANLIAKINELGDKGYVRAKTITQTNCYY